MGNMWFIVCVLFAGFLGGCVDGLGVNWGTFASHQLPPKTVVKMLQDNGIQKVKLFDSDPTVITALAGSGIEVMIAIPNLELSAMNDFDAAKAWVKQNVTRYTKEGVNITYIAIGNEPFLQAYNGTFQNVTFPALENIQNALDEAGIGNKIKATIPFNADVYNSPSYNPVPSAGRFRDDVNKTMTQIVKFLDKHNAPFIVNIYPFLSIYFSHGAFPMDFAFFDGNNNPLIDNEISYTNMFDANYDTLVSSLKAAGFENMTIMVGEVGWPTDGDKDAKLEHAQRFYNGLLPKLAKNKGTPLRPGYIEVYLFSLSDEDAKSILPGNFERHWGIFTYDGKPKFPMDFSGQGKNKSLIPAQNVTYLPQKWCTLKPDANTSKLEDNVNYACQYGDCTPLANGSSCGNLDTKSNASYAFNRYFQNQNQVEGSCDFDGLAMVTTKNISKGDCNFIIQINEPIEKSASPPAPSPSSSSESSSSSPKSSSESPSTSPAPSLLALPVLTVFTVLSV